MTNNLIELLRMAIEMNDSTHFQITFRTNGSITYDDVPTFSINVSQNCDFENTKFFNVSQYLGSIPATDENIAIAKEWLKELHGEMMA